MSSILNALPRPAIIAHRGSSAYKIENTVPSFLLAIEQKADAIELDVQLTADNYVVVFHDAFVDHLTNGTGRVADYSFRELRQLTFSTPSSSNAIEEKIPSLSEVFDAVGSRIFYNIELKNFGIPRRELPLRVIEIITSHNLASHVLISSFNPLMVRVVNRSQLSITTGLLIKYMYRVLWIGKLYTSLVDHHSIHLPFELISPRIIENAQLSGKIVFTYTLNDPRDIRQAVRWGVDGIITDDPLTARKAFDEADYRQNPYGLDPCL